MSCRTQLTDIDLGSTVRLAGTLRIDGEIATGTVTVQVKRPNGTTYEPTVSNPSAGSFETLVVADAPGQWFYRFECNDPKAAEEGSFIVRKSAFP